MKDRKIEELLGAVDRCPGVHLVVAGKGVLRSLVEQAAAANPRIIFVDYLSPEKIAEYTCAGDVIYYGFDPDNPNAKYSAPNKLFEALSAGRPLITGDFGEIADVVREQDCGIVLSRYGVDEICAALHALSDGAARQSMASNAHRFGKAVMNWGNGEKTLYREYSSLIPGGFPKRVEAGEQILQIGRQAGGDSAMAHRILHVVDTLGKGGLENGLVNLIDRLDPRRFEHVVCAIRGLGANVERLPTERVKVICLGKHPDSRFQTLTLSRAIRKTSPDIVHSRNWAAIESVVATWGLRGPAIVHSEHGIESDGKSKEPWRRICFRRLAYGLADQVVSVSSQLRDLHARQTGFPRDRIRVIHNGVDCMRFRPDPAGRIRMRHELNLSDEDLCIGCVRNLLPVKDHLTLLRALSVPNQQSNRWRLLMVGEGPERLQLKAFVNAHEELKHRVRFLGSSNRVPELLSAMDIYVLPSLYEGIANSLLEAMATGLPVVATAAGGNPEVVVDGESGLLFPVRDELKLASLLGLLAARTDLRQPLGAGPCIACASSFRSIPWCGNMTSCTRA